MLLVSGGTPTLDRLARANPGRLGFLVTPRNQTRIATANRDLCLPWAVDNGAYAGFDRAAFRVLLRRCTGKPGCLFVVCPDVVGNAHMTLTLFDAWADEVQQTGHPIAFVGQDGAESLDIPWNRFDCWFVGGSTAWKLSQVSAGLILEAKRRGKWVHMGRVNSRRRMLLAYDLGCDSVDGSGPTRFGDKYTANFVRWLRDLHEQPVLFTEDS